MVGWNDPVLSMLVQAQMLSLDRLLLYYRSLPSSEWGLQLDRLIDITYTKHPELRHRRITTWLESCYGFHADKRTALSRIQKMDTQAVYPRQGTSKPNPVDRIYPYLLKDVQASYPNHVWSINIIYIPIRKSWLYLTAITDWYSRYVLPQAMSDTLEVPFVLGAYKYAPRDAGPSIMNSDQGSHFTSPKYINSLLGTGILISMSHRGRAYDNISIERFRHSLKYGDIYLKDYSYPREARLGIRRYTDLYNNKHPHQSLDYKTPAEVYFNREQLPSLSKYYLSIINISGTQAPLHGRSLTH